MNMLDNLKLEARTSIGYESFELIVILQGLEKPAFE